MDRPNRFVRILILLGETLNDHYVVKTLIQFLPIIWSTIIIPDYQKNIFKNVNGTLTKQGVVILIIVSIASLLTIILSEMNSCRDRELLTSLVENEGALEGELELLKTLSEAENSIEEQNNRRFREMLSDYRKKEEIQSFVGTIVYPKARISDTLSGIGQCFSTISGLRRSDFLLSGAIRIQNKNSGKKNNSKWEWVVPIAIGGTASIDELLNNDSSFKIVATGCPFYYANDKSEAAENGEYYMDGKDKAYGSGSIVCAEIDEEIGKWVIRLIVSISTYGRKIVSDEDLKEGIDLRIVYEDRIRDIVFKQFEGELKEELLWYGVERIDFEKGKLNRQQYYDK